MSCENSRYQLLQSLVEKSTFTFIRYVMEEKYYKY